MADRFVMSKYQQELTKASNNVKTNCTKCGKELFLLNYDYQRRLKNKNGIFCSFRCSMLSRPEEEKTRDTERIKKVALSQKGTSRPECGRKGRKLSQETIDKIRLKKIGIKCPKDTDIILRELQNQYYQKAVTTIDIIPDAIFFRDGKLVAFELEKKPWYSAIQKKMANYDNDTQYDEVIIVWYNLQGERLKEYRKINGEWTVYTGDRD